MSRPKDDEERWAHVLLWQVVQRSNADRDALPGSVVKLVKQAATILRKRIQAREK